MTSSVVIPTYRRAEPLRDTLAGVLACEPTPEEVIVVDGDPDRAAWPVVADLAAPSGTRLRYLHAPLGVTAQRNRGVEAATGDVIVFLDDDVEVGRDLFARLSEAYAEPGVIGVTGRVLEPGAERVGGPGSRVRRWLLGGGEEGKFTRYGYPRYVTETEHGRDVEMMPGCFMSAMRDAALAVGFDERLTRYALAEDEDFSCRLSRLGRIRYVPEIVVEHKKLGFRSYDSREFGRLVVVNRAYLFRKNFPQTRIARLQFGLLVLLLLGHRVANREWRGAQGLLEGAVTAWRTPVRP